MNIFGYFGDLLSARAISSCTSRLAMHRQEFMVYYKRLTPEEYRMLTAIQAGEALGVAFEAAFINSSMDGAARPAFLQECFHQWAILGWLCERELPA